MRALTPADDNLHTPTSADMFWTETAWFAFAVPDRRITAHVYPVFRTNQKICSAAVYVWDDTGETDHQLLYCHNYWHLPLPEDLTRMRLANGLSYDVLEPLRTYRVRYDSDDVRLDLHYEGLFEPRLASKEDHLDQPCRVSGQLCLHGETLRVDGYEMRDKSWHVRSDKSLALPPDIAEGSYSYAINGNSAFLVRTAGSDKNRTTVQGGWLWRDGVVAALKTGQRGVQRAPGRPPRHVVVEGTDELGRAFRADGETINRFACRSTPAIFAWLSGTRWTLDGTSAWGEDQEWSAGTSKRSESVLPGARR